MENLYFNLIFHHSQKAILSWSTKDPRILFPVQSITKRYAVSYSISPYSLPPNHPTSISLTAYFGIFKNQSTSNTFPVEVVRAPLKANLMKGVNKLTIGSRSGMVKFTSNQDDSRHPPLVYQWSCHETRSGQPCYFNFGISPMGYHRDPLLITRALQSLPNIMINSSWFMANNQYLLGLQVFDANNSRRASETEYTMLQVVEGVRPQVHAGPVYIKGEWPVPYSQRFSTFLIPFGSSIVIKGGAFLQTGIARVQWESSNFRHPLAWTSKRVNPQEMETELNLHEGRRFEVKVPLKADFVFMCSPQTLSWRSVCTTSS